MKYETPELTALTPAINAIQGGTPKLVTGASDGIGHPQGHNEPSLAYTDWE